MTRFARAKGSKSSNEKAPEDGTPWEVMKEQLLNSKKDNEYAKKRQEAENQRIQNYENFLKEQKTQKRNATWCDFPEPEQKREKMLNETQNGNQTPEKKKNKRAKNKIISSETLKEDTGEIEVIKVKKTESNTQEYEISNEQLNKEEHKISKKKKKNKTLSLETSTEDTAEKSNDVLNKKEHVISKKKKNKQEKLNNEASVSTFDKADSKDDDVVKKTKNNKKANKNLKNPNSADDLTNINNLNNEESTTSSVNKQNKIKGLKKKNNKFVDGVPVRRKEVTERSFQLIINGKDVELVRFEGFPIMKKDAERLADLKANMMNKGIPKSEVQRTIKLERRRAEKALARVKRDVCYNCRKGGHNLSDCPELKSKIPGGNAPDGVCFKCGSTEHRQFECKVQRDKEFRFATCFICKEPGHIARQCPDNPKGLYPNGGSCKLCGDVTHLRKDCPTIHDKKEETSVKLQTLDSTDNLEGIASQAQPVHPEGSKKPKKIKF